MSRELIVEVTPFGARAAVLNDGRLVEIKFADRATADIRGQIFLGRVKSIDKAQDAAFVDCGIGQDAYLTARDARWLADHARGTPIAKQVEGGRAVLVQGKRAGTGRKGARVTSDIQVPGVFLIFRPRRSAIELSGRLAQSKDADAMRARAAKLFPQGGITLRSAAAEAKDEELRAEAERLQARWQEVSDKAEQARPPACLLQRDDPIERVLQDALNPRLKRLVVGDRITLTAVRGYLETWLPALTERLTCTPRAFETCGIEEQLEQALDPVVALPGGGNLVIEQTAALTAIDVNGGGRTAREVNLAAAPVIARELRLRRIGGTIVVDFVDLANHRERAELQAALESAFARDPAPVQIMSMTSLGLVQISRERLGPSLAERLQRPCPTCAGHGRIATLRHSAERLFAELSAAAQMRVQVRLAVDLYHHIMVDAAEAWRDFAARQGIRPLRLVPDETLPPGGFKVDRLPNA